MIEFSQLLNEPEQLSKVIQENLWDKYIGCKCFILTKNK
jgi:hypothetical protein